MTDELEKRRLERTDRNTGKVFFWAHDAPDEPLRGVSDSLDALLASAQLETRRRLLLPSAAGRPSAAHAAKFGRMHSARPRPAAAMTRLSAVAR